MKKRNPKKLTLYRETLLQLTRADLKEAAGGAAGTFTYEGSCDNSFCPCPGDRTGATE